MAEESKNWFALSAEDVARELGVDPAKGLSAAEAQQRLQKYGPNQLAAKKKESAAQAFLRATSASTSAMPARTRSSSISASIRRAAPPR